MPFIQNIDAKMIIIFLLVPILASRKGFDLILYDDLDAENNQLSLLHQLDKIERKSFTQD